MELKARRKKEKRNKEKGKRKREKSANKETPERVEQNKNKDVELPVSLDGKKVREIKKKEGINIFGRLKLRRNADSSFLITMLFSNGCSRQFVLATNKETFKYKGRTYHLRYENSWFDLSFNQYRLYYFDDYPEPIDRKVIKQGDEKFFAVTSSNVKPLIKQSYVKALQEGADLGRYLKMTLLITVITLLIVIAVGVKTLFGGL